MTDQDPTQAYRPPAAPPVDPAASATADLTPGEPMAPVTPVSVAGARPGRSRTRWIVAGVVTLAVAGVVAGGTLLLTGQSKDPDVLLWTPKDRTIYVEVRLDLPGAQQTEFAKILSALPGFDDQAAFPAKIGEVLDRIVGEATEGTYDYRTDIDPWFGGQLSFSVGPTDAAALAAGSADSASVLVLLGVEDQAKATAWVGEVLTTSGATSSTQDYNGTTITLVTAELPEGLAGELPQDMELPETGYAIVGPVLAIGDVESLKAAIDTKGIGGLATNPQFTTAEASVTNDRMAFAYSDTASTFGVVDAITDEMDPDGQLRALAEIARELMPPWNAVAVRAENGAFVMDTRALHVDAWGTADARGSAIAGLVPADTIFLTTGHSVGDGIGIIRDLVGANPALKDGLYEVEQALDLIGGFDAFSGWIGDLGVAVVPDGAGVVGGIVITPTDAEAAERLFSQLTAFLQLAAGDLGLDIREEEHGGATITIIDLGPLSELAGEATGGMVPVPDGNVELAFTVTDQVVVIGLGSSFVRDVLDARDGPSLADDARFTALLERAGATHSGLGWFDLASTLALVEPAIPADERGAYEADVKPYLAAFDAIISSNVPGEELDRGTIVITLKE